MIIIIFCYLFKIPLKHHHQSSFLDGNSVFGCVALGMNYEAVTVTALDLAFHH
jgi:hypothetical protein